jgi:glyoxylase-like metal-dependent hydrolase (beta-lactamase superfamily II)/rhodanese-related sulfurtransferase
MIFKQLFDKISFTFTYFIADSSSNEAIIIDPVDTKVAEYLELLKSLGLTLKYSFETHVHADHISASGLLRQATGAQTCIGLHCGSETADNQLQGEEIFSFGRQSTIRTLSTPGHTPGSMSFLWQDKVFTGDALFIGGCGRTDFQNGNPGNLYDSVTQKLFTLPGETLVYPAHDYKGDFVSCIYQEKTKNPRLAGKTRDEFIDIMQNLNLPMPKLINKAVPANLYCGIEEEEASQMANSNKFQNPDKERRGVQGNINHAKQLIKQIDLTAAKAMIQSKDVVILDVREQNEYDLGHIKNSIFLPRGKVKSEVESVLSTTDKDTQILIYCASGNRSALAGLIMQELGYTNVVSLSGGYIAWKRQE